MDGMEGMQAASNVTGAMLSNAPPEATRAHIAAIARTLTQAKITAFTVQLSPTELRRMFTAAEHSRSLAARCELSFFRGVSTKGPSPCCFSTRSMHFAIDWSSKDEQKGFLHETMPFLIIIVQLIGTLGIQQKLT